MQKFSIILEGNQGIKNYNHMIDYTSLKEDNNIDKIESVCRDAKEGKYYSVCIKPDFISVAKSFLDGSDVKVCSVISFPGGIDSTKDKIVEASKAIAEGADEIDVVMNYKKLIKGVDEKDEKILEYVEDEIRELTSLCHGENNVVIKVIIETDLLDLEKIKKACEICQKAGVDYVKTSTGYVEVAKQELLDQKLKKVKYMKDILGDRTFIKVSGGIKTIEDIEKCLQAGADRIGTSAKIVY